MPFRTRPMYAAGLDFVVQFGMTTSMLADCSSFPSDHAVLFFPL